MPEANTVYSKNSIVKFNQMVYNNGNHFNPGDSIFIAPHSGLYFFSWTVQTYGSERDDMHSIESW